MGGGHVHASAHECAGQREDAGQRAIPTVILSSSLPYSSEIGRSLPVQQQQQLPGMPPASPTLPPQHRCYTWLCLAFEC